MTELVAIGRIVKPFGVKGDVRVQSLSDVPGRFESLHQVIVEMPSGKTMETIVNRVRKDRDSYVIGLEGLSSPEAASIYRGSLLKIPQDTAPALPEGQYYEYQLIGMTVSDERGESLGILEEILPAPSHPIFVIRQAGKERLIPGSRSVISRIDVEQRTMAVCQAGLIEDQHAV
jgi:16S rRNA processing protein RimM